MISYVEIYNKNIRYFFLGKLIYKIILIKYLFRSYGWSFKGIIKANFTEKREESLK